jgi:hypothetical protein
MQKVVIWCVSVLILGILGYLALGSKFGCSSTHKVASNDPLIDDAVKNDRELIDLEKALRDKKIAAAKAARKLELERELNPPAPAAPATAAASPVGLPLIGGLPATRQVRYDSKEISVPAKTWTKLYSVNPPPEAVAKLGTSKVKVRWERIAAADPTKAWKVRANGMSSREMDGDSPDVGVLDWVNFYTEDTATQVRIYWQIIE